MNISRRTSLKLLTGGAAAVATAGLARAQATPPKPTTNIQALQALPVLTGTEMTLVARFGTYDVDLEYGVDKDGKPAPGNEENVRTGRFKFLTRTWGTKEGLDDNMLGPVIVLEPGQDFNVTVTNQMFEEGDYKNYGPPEPKPEDWYPILDRKKGPSAFLHKQAPLQFPFFGNCGPDTRLADFKIEEVNVPKNYNLTNLHLHGLQVVPHLFEPMGTSDPKSDYLTVRPGKSYTYKFKIPEDQPAGTYWYHPHRHNSVAIQAWGGMAGLLIVRGAFDKELEAFGVERDFPFAVHDPHVRIERYPKGEVSGVAKVGRFLDNQNNSVDVTFLVTGRYRPTFTIKRNEIVRLRHLTATVENLSAFRIVKKKEGDPKTVSRASPESENQPFYIVASDGIAYEKPVRQTSMVCAGGERHDLLLQIDEPGEYYVLSDKLNHIQFFGTGPRDYILATIRVTDEAAPKQTPIEEMRFTSGIPPAERITEKDIVRRRHFVFDLDGNTCVLPFPQFRINDVSYDPQKVAFSLPQGQVEEWIVTNPNSATHPLHIHVNPFLVKEAYCAFEPDPKLVPPEEMADVKARVEAMHRLDYPGMWRDSIIIPPNGYLRIWVRLYADYVGKTVFHCHFLAHEETGMIQNFLITPAKKDAAK